MAPHPLLRTSSYIILFVFLFPFLLVAQTNVNYTNSSIDFPNPERGFYYPTNSNDGLLDEGGIAGLRNDFMPWQANYQVHSTLVYRYFMLTNFINGPISEAFLEDMQTDFNTIRNAGAKLIVRFSYINEGDDDPPPYGDATKSQVLSHIQQIAPILQANADVIAAVQSGFIGVYGEGYYTDHFGFAALPEDGGTGYLTAQNWDDRNEVITALLAALPENRMIQVRYPQQKQKFVYGNAAPTTSAPSGGRIGFHNDCFLASNADFGTFTNYDEWSPAHTTMVTDLRNYKAQDSQTVVVGGETCAANVDMSGDEQCSADGGRADSDLALFHYSFLNSDYNNADVNNQWIGVCLDDIKLKLGYRFVLQSGSFPAEAQPGQQVTLDLSITNEGYAAPFNPRGVEYILRNTTTNDLYYAAPNSNPQQWQPGTTTNLNQTFCLPNNIPFGQYELLLHLPDPEPTLYGNPNYSIRLANTLPNSDDVWESNTGFNQLGHTITVNNTATGSACAGSTTFSISSPLPVTWLNFSVASTDKAIKLYWKVSAEENNQGFQIERSTNGRDFADIGWVDSEQSGDGNYQYTDQGPFNNQKYFYRLKQMDWDDRYSYSVIREASLPTAESPLAVFPNPSDGTFELKSAHLHQTIVEIFDSNGQSVWLQSHDFQQQSLLLSLSLAPGVYFVRCSDTKYQEAVKLVIR
ncbi:DUF4832 domain-containing protein [Lewinella cohaerens]|uniref:DUF4832 domain-containing protein n=1 Tax=Lewinella cohaerens TaxID=70995 RepID=UPI0003648EB3|nr:DUF4832 domain-containing protein [Lewinella cohaerens]